MSDLSVSNLFVDGQVIDADKFNTNYSGIVTYINNRNSGASTWDTLSVLSGTTTPLVVNNSTGTQDICQIRHAGTEDVMVINDGGFVNFGNQEYAYTKASAVHVIATGVVKLTDYVVQSQTHSSMNSSGKFSVQITGKYLITCFFDAIRVTATNPITFYIYKNGSAISKAVKLINVSTSNSVYLTDILDLAANDYIEIYKSSTGTIAIGGGAGTSTTFYVHKLS